MWRVDRRYSVAAAESWVWEDSPSQWVMKSREEEGEWEAKTRTSVNWRKWNYLRLIMLRFFHTIGSSHSLRCWLELHYFLWTSFFSPHMSHHHRHRRWTFTSSSDLIHNDDSVEKLSIECVEKKRVEGENYSIFHLSSSHHCATATVFFLLLLLTWVVTILWGVLCIVCLLSFGQIKRKTTRSLCAFVFGSSHLSSLSFDWSWMIQIGS